MFEGFDSGRPLVDRACIVHRDDDEWCLQAGRCGENCRGLVRSSYLSLDKRVSELRVCRKG